MAANPMGWALGDARIPEDDPYGYPGPYRPRHGLEVTKQERHEWRIRQEAEKRQADADLVQLAVPAILADLLASLPSLLHVVRLCDSCKSLHFLPRPENVWPCNRVECECWCAQGTGQ